MSDNLNAKMEQLWHRLSAKQGNAKAQVNLGMGYSKGHGVPQDYKIAMEWFRLSADQGNAFAQYNLGVMYERGQGIPQDYKTAVKWYRLAAKQGNSMAQNNLDAMYETARGVLQDPSKTPETGTSIVPTNSSVFNDIQTRLFNLKKLEITGLITKEESAQKRKTILDIL